jgi:hypothetical protein
MQVLAALLLSCAMASAAIPGLCNTGLSNGSGVCTGPVVPAGNGSTTDANWTIAVPSPSAPSAGVLSPCATVNSTPQCSTALTYSPAWVDYPDGAWLKNNDTSEWITPQTENNLGGQYVYAITFPVPTGFNHVTIVGKLLSDNEVWGIWLGSGPLECIAEAGLAYDNNSVNSAANFTPPWTTFRIVKAPVTSGGTATLYIVDRNRGDGGIDSDPTGHGSARRVRSDHVHIPALKNKMTPFSAIHAFDK